MNATAADVLQISASVEAMARLVLADDMRCAASVAVMAKWARG